MNENKIIDRLIDEKIFLSKSACRRALLQNAVRVRGNRIFIGNTKSIPIYKEQSNG